MFEIFRQYRNVIAHGQRFYSFTSDLDTAQLSLNFINNMLEYEFMDKSKYKKGIGKNDIYSLIISIMIFTKATNIRENLVEELLEIYEKMEKYCKYNLFNVIGIEKIDIEKLWVLNRLLKCL
ncbi:hypothetical protein PYH67_11810 [Staphylococcus epidermidis]|nr:hypothetical protein PYH67_11810 [Staphylococcus epidermidis]